MAEQGLKRKCQTSIPITGPSFLSKSSTIFARKQVGFEAVVNCIQSKNFSINPSTHCRNISIIVYYVVSCTFFWAGFVRQWGQFGVPEAFCLRKVQCLLEVQRKSEAITFPSIGAAYCTSSPFCKQLASCTGQGMWGDWCHGFIYSRYTFIPSLAHCVALWG